MKITSCIVSTIIVIAYFSATASAQRQTKLYIDDGFGAFSTLSAPLGGGAITLPGASITFPTTNGAGVLTNGGTGSLSWVPISGFAPAFLYTSSGNLVIVANGNAIPMSAFSSGFTPNGGGLFTANVAGTYKIDWSIEANTNGTLLNKFAFEQNATPQVYFDVINATTVSGTCILNLAAGDVIGIFNLSGGTVTLEGSNNVILAAHMTAVRIQ